MRLVFHPYAEDRDLLSSDSESTAIITAFHRAVRPTARKEAVPRHDGSSVRVRGGQSSHYSVVVSKVGKHGEFKTARRKDTYSDPDR